MPIPVSLMLTVYLFSDSLIFSVTLPPSRLYFRPLSSRLKKISSIKEEIPKITPGLAVLSSKISSTSSFFALSRKRQIAFWAISLQAEFF